MPMGVASTSGSLAASYLPTAGRGLRFLHAPTAKCAAQHGTAVTTSAREAAQLFHKGGRLCIRPGTSRCLVGQLECSTRLSWLKADQAPCSAGVSAAVVSTEGLQDTNGCELGHWTFVRQHAVQLVVVVAALLVASIPQLCPFTWWQRLAAAQTAQLWLVAFASIPGPLRTALRHAHRHVALQAAASEGALIQGEEELQQVASDKSESSRSNGSELSNSKPSKANKLTPIMRESFTELDAAHTPASVWLPQQLPNGKDRRPVNNIAGVTLPTMIARQLGRLVYLAHRLPSDLATAIKFYTQDLLLGSTWSKLVGLFLAGVPVVALFGLAYAWASGQTLWDGMVNAYGALYKIPGVTVIGSPNTMTTFVMNIIWMVGTFTFAIFLGVVTEDIVNYVMGLRRGRYAVLAANHTVVLGWTSQTVPLLRQMAISNEESQLDGPAHQSPVVVMAERDKEDMDAELRSALRDVQLQWYTREGSPHCVADLQHVAAGQASSIIVLHPEDDEDAGKKQAATLLGIFTARTSTQPRPFLRLQPQNITVESPTDDVGRNLVESTVHAFEASQSRAVHVNMLTCSRDVSVLQAQSAVQPGVASVYCTIVQQSRRNVEFYIKGFQSLEGLSYQQVRRRFSEAVVCGLVLKEGNALVINPPDDAVLQSGDRVVALALTGRFEPITHDRSRVVPGADVSAIYAPGRTPGPDAAKPKSIVVPWWEPNIEHMVQSLAAFVPRGSTVTVVSKTKPEGFPEKKKVLPSCRFAFVEGDPCDATVLSKAGLADADSIILGGIASHSDKEADALTLAMILVMQEALAAAGRDPADPAHVVGTMRATGTAQVANYLLERLGKGYLTAELLQPEELISGIIAQVAAEPDMGALLQAFIYRVSGQEISLRQSSHYHLPTDHGTTFGQVAEVARLKGETAVGYITRRGAMRLAPHTSELHQFGERDRVVVITGKQEGGLLDGLDGLVQKVSDSFAQFEGP